MAAPRGKCTARGGKKAKATGAQPKGIAKSSKTKAKSPKQPKEKTKEQLDRELDQIQANVNSGSPMTTTFTERYGFRDTTKKRKRQQKLAARKPISSLNLKKGDIIKPKRVEHQLDSKPCPNYDPEPDDYQMYFCLDNECFCNKERLYIVMAKMPDGVRCLPLGCHNGKGIGDKNWTEAQKLGHMAVRDTIKFPLDDVSKPYKPDGRYKPLLTEKMFGDYELTEKDDCTPRVLLGSRCSTCTTHRSYAGEEHGQGEKGFG